jgi:hypothetical protein
MSDSLTVITIAGLLAIVIILRDSVQESVKK